MLQAARPDLPDKDGWEHYKDGGFTKEMTMSGATFLCCFTRQMVPKRFRRIRYFGLLAGAAGRHRALPGAPVESLSEKAPKPPRPACPGCWGFI